MNSDETTLGSQSSKTNQVDPPNINQAPSHSRVPFENKEINCASSEKNISPVKRVRVGQLSEKEDSIKAESEKRKRHKRVPRFGDLSSMEAPGQEEEKKEYRRRSGFPQFSGLYQFDFDKRTEGTNFEDFDMQNMSINQEEIPGTSFRFPLQRVEEEEEEKIQEDATSISEAM